MNSLGLFGGFKDAMYRTLQARIAGIALNPYAVMTCRVRTCDQRPQHNHAHHGNHPERERIDTAERIWRSSGGMFPPPAAYDSVP